MAGLRWLRLVPAADEIPCRPDQVVPLVDIYPHILLVEETDACQPCWCNPVVDEDGIIVHNAFDQREAIEHGERMVQ